MFGISIKLPSPVSMELPSPEKNPSFSTIPLAELPYIALHIQTPPDKMPIWTPKNLLKKHQTSAAIWIFGCLGLESRCTFEQLDPHHVCNISELFIRLPWNDLVVMLPCNRFPKNLPLTKRFSVKGQLLQSGSSKKWLSEKCIVFFAVEFAGLLRLSDWFMSRLV